MRKITLVFFIILIASAAVYADTRLDPEDFIYLTPFNALIYPELDYRSNPAYIENIKKRVIVGDIDFYSGYASDKKTRINNSSGGVKGGTEIGTIINIKPDLDFVFFTPLENKSILGIGVNFESGVLYDTLDYINYNGVSENLKKKLTDTVIDTGVEVFFAPKAFKVGYSGFSLGYSFHYDPAIFKWVTDSTVKPAVSYTEALSEPDDSNDFSHGLNFSAGFNMPLKNNELALSINYAGKFTDSSDEYVAVDTDGDGFNDQVLTLFDYLSLPKEKGGPSKTITGKDFKNYTFGNEINLNAGFEFKLDEGKSLLIFGSWKALGLVYNHYAKHILNEDTPKDVSYNDKYYNSSLGSFDAGIAFDLSDKAKKSSFRIGGGYSLYSEAFSQKGDTLSGTNRYSKLNTGNYDEISLGIDPKNNSLVESGVYPAEVLIHKFFIDSSWRWAPEKKVTLFFDIGASGFYDLRTYRVFNTDTRTTWEESSSAWDLDLMVNTAAGVSFPIGKKINFMVDLGGIGMMGDFSFADETHMYDTDLSRFSQTSSVDLLSRTNFDINFNVGFNWSF